MKIAFASSQGEVVDQHFASTQQFVIYELIDKRFQKVASRAVFLSKNCAGGCEVNFDELISVIEDCQAVLALKIGGGAVDRLKEAGIRTFEVSGEINELLDYIIEHQIFTGAKEV